MAADTPIHSTKANAGAAGRSGLSLVKAYASAALIMLLVTLLRMLIDPFLGDNVPYITFSLGVFLAGWFGGFGPGIAASAVGFLIAWYYFIPERSSFELIREGDGIGLVVYAIMSLTIAVFSSSFAAARRKSQWTERLAQERAELLRATLHSIGDAVITTDAFEHVTTLNPAAEAITGWSQAEAVGKPLDRVFQIVDENTGQPVANSARSVLIDGRTSTATTEWVLISRDGTRKYIEQSASPILDAHDRPIGVVIGFDDISESRRIQQQLKQSESDLSDFFENATIGLHWVGPDGIILRANQADMDLVGYSPDEYIGRHIAEFHVDRNVIDDILRRLTAGEKIANHPAQLRCKDGSIRHVLIDSSVLWDNGRFVHTRCFTRDMTERNRADAAHRQLAAIVESSDDAIVGKSLNGVIQSWNTGAVRLFGYTAEEMIGQRIERLIPEDRLNEEPKIIEQLSRGQRVDHFETIRRHKDGRLIHVSLSISPIRDGLGQIVGASKIARDITDRVRVESERKQLLESERAARTEAERAMRLRDEFLAMVSHELRTPLTGILGWAQLLKLNDAEDSRLEAAEAIERGARAQAQLIEDLLDMNRIMSGKLSLDIQTVRLSEVVESALATLRPAAENKSIRIQTTLDTRAAPVKGDAARLQQVMWNLVSNSIKFTPKQGLIQIVVERINSHVEISVADNGIGLNPEFLPHVFDRFRQADVGPTRRHGGLGLGLAIVKQIVELHGGSVSAESAGQNKGATFRICLPISIMHRPDIVEAQPVAAAGDGKISLQGVRALVVDDDRAAGEVAKRMLGAYGAEVSACESARDALTFLETGAPDILLSDIGMPEMDGYEFIRMVRGKGHQIPAIAITAFARPEDRVRALQAGYTMHLSKPVDATELLTVVNALLRNTRNRRS